MYDFVNDKSYYFVVYFDSYFDSKNKVKIKIGSENIFVRSGKIAIFSLSLMRDDVLDAIDYSERALLCCIGEYPMRFELEISYQEDGFFYFNFRREIESDS